MYLFLINVNLNAEKIIFLSLYLFYTHSYLTMVEEVHVVPLFQCKQLFFFSRPPQNLNMNSLNE